MNILDFKKKKQSNIPISMVTCYDFWTSKILNETPIDCVLVGDSLAMVMHGHSNTLSATIEIMALHTQAVVRGAPNKFIIGDLPFLSYRKDLYSNVGAIEQLMRAGAHAVKLEGAKGNLELIRFVVDSGIPVMGHLGLTPQSLHQLGGFRVQGKHPKEFEQIIQEAIDLQEAGCFSLVLECVPRELAQQITKKLEIPTIGIGAGNTTDGQVLVLQDLLGMNPGFHPQFLRRYLNGFEIIKASLQQYHEDVVAKKFPSLEESYE